MLLIGDYDCAMMAQICINKNLYIYNLSSLTNHYIQVTNLLPKGGIGSLQDQDLDIAYLEYILSNNDVYLSFMNIIMRLYEGNHVYLIVTRNEFYDKISESLSDIIKYRYGIRSVFINVPDDFEWIVNNLDYGDFTASGLLILDQDKMRMMNILAENNMIKVEDYD